MYNFYNEISDRYFRNSGKDIFIHSGLSIIISSAEIYLIKNNGTSSVLKDKLVVKLTNLLLKKTLYICL